MLRRLHLNRHQIDVLETLDRGTAMTTDTSKPATLTEALHPAAR